jgi:hypothetical protein
VNKALLDTDIYSEILKAFDPVVVGEASTASPALQRPGNEPIGNLRVS